MKYLIVANWKCNPKSKKLAEKLFNIFSKNEISKKVEAVICPPFIYLYNFSLISSPFKIGAQNCFYKDFGPYTGEISSLMLKSFNCKYVIIGHSERRINFKESDDIINKKLKSVIESGITPIFCVGESLKEKKEGKTKSVIGKQIRDGLKGLNPKKTVIAYEPVWAIGKNNPCKPSDAKEILSFILKTAKTKIIYGGSVNKKNAKEYLNMGFNGLLIGGASLKEEEIIPIFNI